MNDGFVFCSSCGWLGHEDEVKVDAAVGGPDNENVERCPSCCRTSGLEMCE